MVLLVQLDFLEHYWYPDQHLGNQAHTNAAPCSVFLMPGKVNNIDHPTGPGINMGIILTRTIDLSTSNKQQNKMDP